MKRSHTKTRFGRIAVDWAIGFPLLLLFIFASIDFACIHITQCTMENAAFEGARRGIAPGATIAQCQSVAEEIMAAAGIKEYSVVVAPDEIGPLTDRVQVRVEVPMPVASPFSFSSLLRGQTIEKTMVLPCGDAG